MEPGHTLYALKVVACEASVIGDLKGARYFREVATNRDILSKYVVRYFTWWCEEPQFLPQHTQSSLPKPIQSSSAGNSPSLSTNDKPAAKDEASPEAQAIYNDSDMFASRRQLDSVNEASSPRTVGDLVEVAEQGFHGQDSSSSSDGVFFEGASRTSCDSDDISFKMNLLDDAPNDECRDEASRNERQTCQICLIIQMEWCPGPTLRHWLAKYTRLPPLARLPFLFPP
ncbi:putative protein kinase, partial [Gregarina niphandrodes]